MSDRKVYRVAIVGLGRMGSTIDDEMPAGTPPYSIAAACAASDRLEVVAGADTDPAKRQAFEERWGVRALYEDYVEMIRQEAPDMVAICTIGPQHAEMTVAAIEAGARMIYAEKAIACSMLEADAVKDAVQRHGVLFNSGVLRRFDNRYAQARRVIAEGKIGVPQAAVHYGRTNLLHGHIHSIDTLSYLLGDPDIESVWGELTSQDEIVDNQIARDPNAIYHIRFAGGAEGVSVATGYWEFEVLGTEGILRTYNNGTGALLRYSGGERKAHFDPVPYEVPEPDSATLNCLEDLIDAAEQGRPTLGHIDIAHRTTEACLAVAESHRMGRRVHLPIENRSLYVMHK